MNIYWDGQHWGGGSYLVLLLSSVVQLEQDGLNIPLTDGVLGLVHSECSDHLLE